MLIGANAGAVVVYMVCTVVYIGGMHVVSHEQRKPHGVVILIGSEP